jgi:hypothetical protein
MAGALPFHSVGSMVWIFTGKSKETKKEKLYSLPPFIWVILASFQMQQWLSERGQRDSPDTCLKLWMQTFKSHAPATVKLGQREYDLAKSLGPTEIWCFCGDMIVPSKCREKASSGQLEKMIAKWAAHSRTHSLHSAPTPSPFFKLPPGLRSFLRCKTHCLEMPLQKAKLHSFHL